MPLLHSHTLCQALAAVLVCVIWQRVWLFQRTAQTNSQYKKGESITLIETPYDLLIYYFT